MKIKLSKSQWEEMGKKGGWIKLQNNDNSKWNADALVAIRHVDSCIQKLNAVKHELETGVDPKFVVPELKSEIEKILQSLSKYSELSEYLREDDMKNEIAN